MNRIILLISSDHRRQTDVDFLFLFKCCNIGVNVLGNCKIPEEFINKYLLFVAEVSNYMVYQIINMISEKSVR